jgi:hypothetical protein
MRRYLLAIPTYWTFPGGQGPEEIIFDHPTPLDSPGTLRRTLDSLAPLAGDGVQVAVVAAATAPALEAAVEDRVSEVIASPRLPYPVLFFSPSHLLTLRRLVEQAGQPAWLELLSLSGYAAIRNITLILANIMGAEALVSLDDDEVAEDPDFLPRLEDDLDILNREHQDFGVAGIYRDAKREVLLPEPAAAWAAAWPKMRWMNQAFRELILTGPRLKPTPLGFGGNMTLTAGLCRQVCFDPAITRGEDVDYIINARMCGIPFFLDNALAITHLPPDKPHPVWQRLRQDLLRFCYCREKLRGQTRQGGLTQVNVAELRPYPGNFLGDDLEDRAYRSHTLLALEYLAAGDGDAARRTLENLVLMQQVLDAGATAFGNYMARVKAWRELQAWLAQPQMAAQVRQALWG